MRAGSATGHPAGLRGGATTRPDEDPRQPARASTGRHHRSLSPRGVRQHVGPVECRHVRDQRAVLRIRSVEVRSVDWREEAPVMCCARDAAGHPPVADAHTLDIGLALNPGDLANRASAELPRAHGEGPHGPLAGFAASGDEFEAALGKDMSPDGWIPAAGDLETTRDLPRHRDQLCPGQRRPWTPQRRHRIRQRQSRGLTESLASCTDRIAVRRHADLRVRAYEYVLDAGAEPVCAMVRIRACGKPFWGWPRDRPCLFREGARQLVIDNLPAPSPGPTRSARA